MTLGFCGVCLSSVGGGLFECAFFLRSVLPEWVSSPDRWCFPNMGGLILNNVLTSVGVECIVLVTLLTVSDENLTHFVMFFFLRRVVFFGLFGRLMECHLRKRLHCLAFRNLKLCFLFFLAL